MPSKIYTVHYKRGRVNVKVRQAAIDLRGEREAVANAAWLGLMGKNELGDDVDKNSPTRAILMEETLSRYEHQRPDVYNTFKETVKFALVGIDHDDVLPLITLLRR